jgi:hypothetical protein
MSDKKHRYSWGDGQTYAIVRLHGKYYWSVFQAHDPFRLLCHGRSNNRRGAFYAARCYIKRHQNEVYT